MRTQEQQQLPTALRVVPLPMGPAVALPEESGQTDSSSPSLKGKGDGGSSGDPGGSGAASTTNPPLDCNCSPPASLASQPPPDADRDRDLLKNTKEHSFGSDPDKADEDGDKLTDWFEWALGTDPRSSDSDGDGLCDCVEFTQSSSPIWRDTDRDGIDDADEKRLGLKAGTLHSTGGEPLKDWKKGVAPFVYSPVQGALVEGDSRDSDGDGVVDGSDIAPRDPKLGSLGSKEPKPIEEMRKLFQDFAKALKAPVGDNAVPKSDRAKFDELLKALANSPDIHKVLPTRVPGAYARRQAWLDALVEDPTVTARFYSEGLLEHVATVVRNVKNDKNKAGLTPFEQRVKDAWEACRSEAGAWKPCAAYQPDKEQASEPEPVPFQIESFRLTTYVDPGWVAVRMGIDSDDELRKATALVLLLEWCRGADDEKSVVIIEQGNRAEQHGLPNLRIFQQELDLLTKGPFPRGDPKAATGSTGASGEQK